MTPHERAVYDENLKIYRDWRNTLEYAVEEAEMKGLKKGKAEGKLLEVIEKASQEIEPACPHFGQCGGCTYQNLPYEKQVEMKEAQIRAMMDAAVDGDYIWEGVKESPVREG